MTPREAPRSRFVDLKPPDPREFDHLGRQLTCTKCGALVTVFEIPRGHLNPDTYVCGCCLVPVAEKILGPDGEPPL